MGDKAANVFEPKKRSALAEHFFAWAWGHAHGPLEKHYGVLKRDLFAEVKGRVLEIGPGAGINLGHFRKDVQIIGVEPNVFMHPMLRASAEAAGIQLEIVLGYAEALPVPDASVDAVVSTLVLCSVFEPERVLAEVLRVLRAGGRFYFIEHVAAPSGSPLRRLQDWIAPLWRHMGDGCNPNRETWRLVEAAGFSEVRLEKRYIRVPLHPVRPHILGSAVK